MRTMMILALLALPSCALAKNTGVNGHTGNRLSAAPSQPSPEDRHISMKTVCRYRVSSCNHG